MPFESGTFSMSVFTLTDNWPEDALEMFNGKRAGKLDAVKDDIQIGWVSGRHLLENVINEETSILGGYPYLYLRMAQRKIPPALLKAECRLEELVYIKANNNPDVPRKVRKEIKELVTERRLPMMVPQISGVPMIYDPSDRSLYIGATSTKQIDELIGFLSDTLRTKPPVQMTAEEIMVRAKRDVRDYKPIPFFDTEDSENALARDFLTWLWFYSETQGGDLDIEGMGTFATMIDGPLTFAAEGKGSFETVVKNGNPLRSAEARAALNVGKKLKKAKVLFARGNEIWVCSLDADKFTFNSVALPEGEEMDLGSRFAERVQYISMFQQLIRAYVVKFLEDTQGERREAVTSAIRDWAENRESL